MLESQITHWSFILEKSKMMKSQQEIEQTELAAQKLVETNDLGAIKALINGFDDNTEHFEVMFGLVHAIEHLDEVMGSEIALKERAEAVPSMIPHAIDWAKLLHKRILNSALARSHYKMVLKDVDASARDAVVNIIREIKEKAPKQFTESAGEVLDELGEF